MACQQHCWVGRAAFCAHAAHAPLPDSGQLFLKSPTSHGQLNPLGVHMLSPYKIFESNHFSETSATVQTNWVRLALPASIKVMRGSQALPGAPALKLEIVWRSINGKQ